MRLALITVNFNGSEKTLKLCNCLKIQSDPDFKALVIDNGSDKSEVEILRRGLDRRVELKENPINLGFSGGNNIGIKMALERGVDWVLLINNDTLVEPDFIASLKVELENKRGIVGLPLDEDGERISYCGKIRWLKPVGLHIDNPEDAKSDHTNHVIGGGMLIHRDVIEKIGFLDEKYFLYFEDVDYSVRAIRAGIGLAFLERPTIHHSPSTTTAKLGIPKLLRYHYRNALYFNLKNGPWHVRLAVWPWSWWIIMLQAAKVFLMIEREKSIAIMRGVFDFYLNKMGKI